MIRRKRSRRIQRSRKLPKGFVVRRRTRSAKATQAKGISRKVSRRLTEHRLQLLIDRIKGGDSLTASARQLGLQPKAVQQKLENTKLIRKRKGRWVIRDDVFTAMRLYSEGEEKWIVPMNKRDRSAVGKFMNAVKSYLRTNKPESLKPFIGKSVRDIAGKRHYLETDENTLYRLALSSSEVFEEIYKYIV